MRHVDKRILMPPKQKHRIGLARLAVMVQLLALVGYAEEESVFVNFKLQVPMLERHPTIPQIVPDTAAKLAEALTLKLKYWRFRSGGNSDFPRLDIGLKNDSKWEIEMRLVLSPTSSEPAAGPWTCVLYETGDIERRGLPGRDLFREEIVKAFRDRMLTSNFEAVFGLLRARVPLGKESVASLGGLKAVLGLQKDMYQDLVFSEFRIYYCRNCSQTDSIVVCSVGTGYREFPGATPFQAIAVEHLKWQAAEPCDVDIKDHLSELENLKPRVFFLDKLVPVIFIGSTPIKVR